MFQTIRKNNIPLFILLSCNKYNTDNTRAGTFTHTIFYFNFTTIEMAGNFDSVKIPHRMFIQEVKYYGFDKRFRSCL